MAVVFAEGAQGVRVVGLADEFGHPVMDLAHRHADKAVAVAEIEMQRVGGDAEPLDARLLGALVDSVSGGDLVATWVQNSGAWRRVSWSVVAAYVATQIDTKPSAQYATPSDGQTLAVQDDGSDVWLVLAQAAPLATLTLLLPTAPVDSQEVQVASTSAITALVLTPTNASLSGAPASLAAGGFFTMRYDAQLSVWRRTG